MIMALLFVVDDFFFLLCCFHFDAHDASQKEIDPYANERREGQRFMQQLLICDECNVWERECLTYSKHTVLHDNTELFLLFKSRIL